MNRTSTTVTHVFSPRLLKVLFFLFLFHPNILAAGEVTLAWDPNSESNLAGYKLYYDGDSDTEMYKGTGATEGDSPIVIYLNALADIDSPTFTLTGLQDGQYYYFALTALNTEGMESDFSEEVGTEVGTEVDTEEDTTDSLASNLTQAASDASSKSSADSNPSGGVCFITCSMEDELPALPIALAGMLLLLVAAALPIFRPNGFKAFRWE